MSDISFLPGELDVQPPGLPGLVSNRISPRAIPRLARVEVCEGGIIAKRSSLSPVRPPQGAVRGSIRGFSVASRSRLIRRLLGLSWSDLIGSKHASTFQGMFLTLTYPDSFPDTASRWKRDLDTFFKRLDRAYPAVASVWKMELKARKSGNSVGLVAPHFHLLAYSPAPLEKAAFRAWLSRAWYDVVGSNDDKHLRAGTQARAVYGSVSKLMSYCAKYLAKEFDSETETGRVWGEVKELPRGEVYVFHVDCVEFLRRLRRHSSRSGYVRSLSVWRSGFVAFGALAQLLRGLVCSPGVSPDTLNSRRASVLTLKQVLNYRIAQKDLREYHRQMDERDCLVLS